MTLIQNIIVIIIYLHVARSSKHEHKPLLQSFDILKYNFRKEKEDRYCLKHTLAMSHEFGGQFIPIFSDHCAHVRHMHARAQHKCAILIRALSDAPAEAAGGAATFSHQIYDQRPGDEAI